MSTVKSRMPDYPENVTWIQIREYNRSSDPGVYLIPGEYDPIQHIQYSALLLSGIIARLQNRAHFIDSVQADSCMRQ